MTQEDKELLLRDLSARLPHGVMLKHISTEKPFKLFSIKRDEYTSYKNEGVELAVNGIYYDWCVNDTYHDIELYIKPYLFPLSSMTEEQSFELEILTGETIGFDAYSLHDFTGYSEISLSKTLEIIQWCYKNHLDINGLIPMGLANDATGKNIY